MSARPVVALALSAALVTGIAGCDSLPDIDPSRLPDVSLPALPSRSADPAPTETSDPEPARTVTADPEPQRTVTAEPEPEASPTAVSEPSDESTTMWWPWALLGLIVLVLIIVLARRRSARRAWDTRLAKTKSELSWFEDSLIPQILSKSTAAEAAALWQAARPRVLDVDRQLHELAEVGLSEGRTAAANRGLSVLQNLTSAIEGETSTEAVADADQLRVRRAAVADARAQARDWIAPTPK